MRRMYLSYISIYHAIPGHMTVTVYHGICRDIRVSGFQMEGEREGENISFSLPANSPTMIPPTPTRHLASHTAAEPAGSRRLHCRGDGGHGDGDAENQGHGKLEYQPIRPAPVPAAGSTAVAPCPRTRRLGVTRG